MNTTTTQEDTRMADVKELQVGFRKTVSDGNYGNETHEVRITVTSWEEEELVTEVLAKLSKGLEDHVNALFKQSPNENIRYAMESTEERVARYKREAEERKARFQQERAEREARLAAQAAQEAGSSFAGDDDEDAEDEDGDDDCPF
jgi:nucleoid-associated protein YgaU